MYNEKEFNSAVANLKELTKVTRVLNSVFEKLKDNKRDNVTLRDVQNCYTQISVLIKKCMIEELMPPMLTFGKMLEPAAQATVKGKPAPMDKTFSNDFKLDLLAAATNIQGPTTTEFYTLMQDYIQANPEDTNCTKLCSMLTPSDLLVWNDYMSVYDMAIEQLNSLNSEEDVTFVPQKEEHKKKINPALDK